MEEERRRKVESMIFKSTEINEFAKCTFLVLNDTEVFTYRDLDDWEIPIGKTFTIENAADSTIKVEVKITSIGYLNKEFIYFEASTIFDRWPRLPFRVHPGLVYHSVGINKETRILEWFSGKLFRMEDNAFLFGIPEGRHGSFVFDGCGRLIGMAEKYHHDQLKIIDLEFFYVGAKREEWEKYWEHDQSGDEYEPPTSDSPNYDYGPDD